jgi:hypothetical protein
MAYNRVVRGEIFSSERILDLSSDTARWVYLAMVLECDDFGNIEGGDRRLFRWAHQFSQVKTEADMVRLMSELADADLVRGYLGPDNKPYWHLPRTDSKRRWTSRKWPASPWDNPEQVTTIERLRMSKPAVDLPQVRRISTADQHEPLTIEHSLNNQRQDEQSSGRPAAALPQDYGKPAAIPLRGVGVGVGVGEEQANSEPGPKRGTRLPKDWVLPDEWQDWAITYCREQGLHVQPSQVIEWSLRFADYWHEVPGTKGVKLSWSGTWRNAVKDWYAPKAPRIPPARTALRGI